MFEIKEEEVSKKSRVLKFWQFITNFDSWGYFQKLDEL